KLCISSDKKIRSSARHYLGLLYDKHPIATCRTIASVFGLNTTNVNFEKDSKRFVIFSLYREFESSHQKAPLREQSTHWSAFIFTYLRCREKEAYYRLHSHQY